MREIKIYTSSNCTFCVQAKRMLSQLKLTFEEIGLDDKPEIRQKLSEENGHYRTVPMIFIDNKFIGGYTDLLNLHKQGKLLG
ncbi:MAG: glutaredoxin [Proteobacteria bacterium]|nr:glutaredoxin [Pseudomonadota bacterium]